MPHLDPSIPQKRLLAPPRLVAPPAQAPDPELPALFVHQKRPEWGAAVCAWSRRDRHGYQFEDGRLRIFRTSHLHLLVPKPRETPGDHRTLVRQLRAAAGLSQAQRRLEQGGEVVLSFEQQLAIFHHAYPSGFTDPAWLADRRGEGASRPLKRHRNHVIELAQTKLSREALEPLLAGARGGAGETIVAHLSEVLAATDMVQKQKLAPLGRLTWADAQRLGHQVFSLLHGDQPIDQRVQHFANEWVRVTGQTPSWPLVTAPLALCFPETMIGVRSSILREQAKNCTSEPLLESRVEGRVYPTLVDLAGMVRDRLQATGHEPRDLMDVYDFMWLTLRPAARKVLAELTSTPVADSPVVFAQADQEADAA
ncbi:MAG: hypothetical protein R3B72_19040 [Polyangiaceae bacterium]